MADFIANFVPWKGINATSGLNAEYTIHNTDGFAPGDVVTAPSTNAALRMATLICSAVANLYQLDELDVDSSLGSVLSKLKANATTVFGTTFNSEMIFNKGATFNFNPLTINKTAKIILRERELPTTNPNTDIYYGDYSYGLGNIYTIEDQSYVKGFESKFYMKTASYENYVYYTLSYHSFIDMISEGSTLNKDNSTVFDIQTGTGGLRSVIFYVRPNGNLTSTMITVTDGEKNAETRPEIQILPNKIHYIGRSDGVNREITWKELFEKLDKIQ